MRWIAGLALSLTAASMSAVVAGSAPANAEYQREPVSLAWHPAGPVHSSVAAGGVVYLGGMLDGTGGIAAVDAGTGARLWQVPANDDVRALALSPSGSTLYAGGQFTTVNGVVHRRVVAINVSDHSLVSTFTGSFPGGVRDLAVHGGDLYVGGRITTNASGGIEGGIDALDATTGDKDPSFAFSVDNDVLGLALTGNRLIVSGRFSHVNGSTRNELASIDLSTNTLQSWAPAKLCSSCDQYWDVQTDGTNAYVATSGNAAGAFSLAGNGPPAFPTVRGTGDFQAVWLPGDGRVYYGGHFGLGVWSQGNPSQVVDARMLVGVFTSNGQIDPGFTPWLYSAYPGVWAFTSTPGRLWVGGNFTGEQVNGQNNKQPYVAAYPASGGDNQPPTGTFTSNPSTAWAGSTSVQLVQQAIHDNVTPDNLIDRRVDWGDGSQAHWTSGTTLTHVYQAAGTYTPKVTLTDEAGNSSGPINATAVTVKVVAVDNQPPTGTFATGTTTAWAGHTTVRVVQQSIHDNVTPDNLITRSVAWGDGTTTDWTSGTSISHVYRSGGTFTPQVTLTDEAGNTSAGDGASAVVVEVDATGPRVKVTTARPKHSVKAWRHLHGKATDAGVGVRRVWVAAIEKHAGHWYAYNARTHRWHRASTKAAAFARSKAFVLTPDSHHRWSTTKLRGLREGKLVVRAWADDEFKNRSATVTHRVRLSRR